MSFHEIMKTKINTSELGEFGEMFLIVGLIIIQILEFHNLICVDKMRYFFQKVWVTLSYNSRSCLLIWRTFANCEQTEKKLKYSKNKIKYIFANINVYCY